MFPSDIYFMCILCFFLSPLELILHLFILNPLLSTLFLPFLSIMFASFRPISNPCFMPLLSTHPQCQWWLQPHRRPLRVPPLRKSAIPRRRQTSASPCWVRRGESWVQAEDDLELERSTLCVKGAESSPRMDEAMSESSTSAAEEPCTSGTSGQLSWTCSGATSSSSSPLPLLEPGSYLEYFGTWWPWFMETWLVRRKNDRKQFSFFFKSIVYPLQYTVDKNLEVSNIVKHTYYDLLQKLQKFFDILL